MFHSCEPRFVFVNKDRLQIFFNNYVIMIFCFLLLESLYDISSRNFECLPYVEIQRYCIFFLCKNSRDNGCRQSFLIWSMRNFLQAEQGFITPLREHIMKKFCEVRSRPFPLAKGFCHLKNGVFPKFRCGAVRGFPMKIIFLSVCRKTSECRNNIF